MKTAREYQARTSVHFIDDADIPTGYASRLWTKLTPGGIERRVDDISKQLTGAGWKNLPQELVDAILGYLLDDPDTLKACSLTCKHLFGAVRPLLHQQFVCSDSRLDFSKPRGSLFSRGPGAFERMIDADRLGVLPYTRHLALKLKPLADYPRLNPEDLKAYLSHLRSIARLHTLTLKSFYFHPFIPVFNEYFGMFANTLRHLDIQISFCTDRELLYIICQFPLLEDLTVVSPVSGAAARPGDPTPIIMQLPPLRGKLVLVQTISRQFLHILTGFPGGLNFRSLELFRCGDPGLVVAACSNNVTSTLWIIVIPLDLRRNVALERLELKVWLTYLPLVHEWVNRTLPPFLYGPWCDYDGPHSFFENYMPAVASKGFVNYEYVSQVENRVWELGNP